MYGFSHIVLHLTLCSAAAAHSGTIPVKTVVVDKVSHERFNDVTPVSTAPGDDPSVSFDLPFGVYRVMVATPGKSGCRADRYFAILSGKDRNMRVTLTRDPVQSAVPSLLIGTLPPEYAYLQPAIVAFPEGTTCDGTVSSPLDPATNVEDDPDAYYADLYPNKILAMPGVVLALRLGTSTGGHHYVRIPVKFLGESLRWPSIEQFNISADVVDAFAGKPEDVLLCPRLYQTTTS